MEDDLALAGLVSDYLRRHGFAVAIEGDGARAAQRIVAERPALVVLDVELPGLDGHAICRQVRGTYAGPILMLTARGEQDEVLGLEGGADDYLVKPARPAALLARVRALLRRSEGTAPATRLELPGLVVDAAAREAVAEGRALDLTSGEFDLLFLLASHAGQPLSRQQLYEGLHGRGYGEADRAVDLQVSRLRQKTLDTRVEIKTVRGVGYQLSLREEGAARS